MRKGLIFVGLFLLFIFLISYASAFSLHDLYAKITGEVISSNEYIIEQNFSDIKFDYIEEQVSTPVNYYGNLMSNIANINLEGGESAYYRVNNPNPGLSFQKINEILVVVLDYEDILEDNELNDFVSNELSRIDGNLNFYAFQNYLTYPAERNLFYDNPSGKYKTSYGALGGTNYNFGQVYIIDNYRPAIEGKWPALSSQNLYWTSNDKLIFIILWNATANQNDFINMANSYLGKYPSTQNLIREITDSEIPPSTETIQDQTPSTEPETIPDDLTPETTTPTSPTESDILTTPATPSTDTTENGVEEISCSSSCKLDNTCYPLGYRKDNKFCSENLEFINQFGDDSTCENNFQCSSNVCIGRSCISLNLWQRFIGWFNNLFGNEEENSYCIDSDNGKDYYIKGNVTSDWASQGPSELYTSIDKCGENNKQDQLTEYSCSTDPNYPNSTTATTIRCSNGCFDGRCLREDEDILDNLDNILEIDKIEVFMSNQPQYIVCLNQQLGPHKADLILRGVSQTNPSFTIQAKASYDFDPHFNEEDIEMFLRDEVPPGGIRVDTGIIVYPTKKGKWIINNIQYSDIPSGYNAPLIVDSELSGSTPIECIQVKSGGNSEYVMTWEILGETTSGVRVNPIMNLIPNPWIGDKKFLIIKAGSEEPGYTYGSSDSQRKDNVIKEEFDLFSKAFFLLSNGLVNISYEIKESIYDPPYSPGTDCNSYFPNENDCVVDIARNTLANVGINETNFQNDEYDHIVINFYRSMYDKYGFRSLGVPFGGQKTVFSGCPQCEWLLHDEGWLDIWKPMHEFIHGFGAGHDETPYNIIGADPENVKEEDLWGTLSDNHRTFPLVLMAGSSYERLRMLPIRRAELGWVSGNQTTLITQSGIYDIYSDNNDLTFDLDKPYILQILVKRSDGSSDFVYVTAPLFEDYSPPLDKQIDTSFYGEYKDNYNKGILLITIPFGNRGHYQIYNYNNSLDPTGAHFGQIPQSKQVHLKWENTDVIIKNLGRDRIQPRIEVIYLN